MTFDLPMPPSVNAMFATDFKTKRRFISKDYTSWKKKAGEALKLYCSSQLEKPYGIHIRLNLDHRGDVDNRCKPVLDLLVQQGVIVGDQWVNTLRVDRDRTVRECSVEVWTIDDDFRPIGEIVKPIMTRIAQQVSDD